ncbi:MAG: hypothetical protein NXI18_21905 [Alphaproteobacteria bacterium]|nr:hypothetical protein [Alphaproteobacteria bacterium]
MNYHLDEIGRPLIFFVLVFAGLALMGLVESRVEARHPEELERLGGGRVVVVPASDSFSKGLRWLRFTGVDHFRLGDPVLSVLCVATTVVQVAVVGGLLGVF